MRLPQESVLPYSSSVGDIENKKPDNLPRRKRSEGGLAPFGAVYVALLALGVVGALIVYLLLVTFVPGASGTRLEAMKTALLVVAGSGAGAGLYVQYRKQQTDEAKSALDHSNSRRDQDKLFTERYTQAVAQLGSEKAAVRLGGVYALARIADDSARDRSTCMKVLCAYLRIRDASDADKPEERQVRLTAQSVLTERLQKDHEGFWANAEIDLRGARLVDVFDLRGAHVGNGDFRQTTFEGAWFDGVTFAGDTFFDEATFTFSASLQDAKFDGYTEFGGVTFFAGARFDRVRFESDAGFSRTEFGGPVQFNGAIFTKEVYFDGAAFSDEATFRGATFGQQGHFDECTFAGDSWFKSATFNDGAAFGGAQFLAHADFDGSTFAGAVFLPRVSFKQGAWFRDATFGQTALFNGMSTVEGAHFEQATFHGDVKFVEATLGPLTSFSEARFHPEHQPIWPEGFAEPKDIEWLPNTHRTS